MTQHKALIAEIDALLTEWNNAPDNGNEAQFTCLMEETLLKCKQALICQAAYQSRPQDETLAEKLEDAQEALFKIKQWSEAYPEDIFIPPTPEQWKQAHEYFKEHWGFSIDKISGEYGRRIFKGVKEYLEVAEKALQEIKQALSDQPSQDGLREALKNMVYYAKILIDPKAHGTVQQYKAMNELEEAERILNPEQKDK